MSKHMIWLVTTIFVFAAILAGCGRDELLPAATSQPTKSAPALDSPAPAVTTEGLPRPSAQPRVLLGESLPLQRVEIPAEALAYWRLYAAQRPTLLVLSSDPMLVPVPQAMRSDVEQWLTSASAAELARQGNPRLPEQRLEPRMTVDAALRAGLFGQVAWAMPVRGDGQAPALESLRKRFGDSDQFGAEEAAGLTMEDFVLKGQVRGVPFLAAPLPNLPKLTGPLVVHIDQSFFQGLYKNEVATPLLPLVLEVLDLLRERQLPVLAVTFCYGNLEGRINLDARFLGDVLARYVEDPSALNTGIPSIWKRQGEILYLQNFFKKEEILQRAEAMEKEAPRVSWVKFALYRAAVENGQGDRALKYLASAVAGDRIYAMEYLPLAGIAYDKQRPDAAMKMFALAALAFPEDPQIKLKMAQLAGEMGDRKTALQLVEQLQQLPWSTVYYPQMPDYLKGFAAFLRAGPAPALVAPGRAAGNRPPGNPPMNHAGVMPAGHP